ncbi:OmpA family protein [Dankookia sp. GCM10030260]|uniref:OmpA family protein n=1 Tax=Dankookia sp. GCM10030260 TaxID=3273390 RepID=UPI00360D422B
MNSCTDRKMPMKGMGQMARFVSRMHRMAGVLFAPIVVAGCVSQSDYDALQAENNQLKRQLAAQSATLAAERQQVGRLQGAIAYTVNSDLLFAPGSWEMRERGKHIIADMSRKLAPTQQNKLIVTGFTDNAPIGPALQRQGITSNQILSQKRAEAVMEYLISQGVRSDMVSARGMGEADPVASNSDAKGRAQNRRVVLSLANA